MQGENAQMDIKQNKINFLVRNGYSQEVIDFACQENLRYDKKYKALPWVARERAKQILDVDKVNYVLDWFRLAEAVDITALNFEEAWKKSDEWHSTLGTDKLEIRRLKHIPLDMSKVEAEIDGYYIVRIDTQKDADREGKLMKHCINSNFFQLWYANHYLFLYSVRDNKNIPHLTFSIEKFLNLLILTEAKGKANINASKKYVRIIKKWLKNLAFTKNYKLNVDLSSKDKSGFDFLLTELKEENNLIGGLSYKSEKKTTLPSHFTNAISFRCKSFINNEEFNKICTFSNLRFLSIKFGSANLFYDDIYKLNKLEILNLSGSSLVSLSPKIGDLSSLRELNLSNTYIKKLPDEIQKLKSLKELNLSYTDIKKLPSGFKELKNLEVLNLSDCCFENFPEIISNLTNLEILIIGKNSELRFKNRFRKIPNAIGKLKKLKVLNVYDGRVCEISPQIGNLKKLESLDLSFNGIKNLPDEIGDLENLRKLDLIFTPLKKLPHTLKKLKNLEFLDLRHCQDLKFHDFSLFQNIKKVRVIKSQILTDIIPNNIIVKPDDDFFSF